jgi:hypothetical protein
VGKATAPRSWSLALVHAWLRRSWPRASTACEREPDSRQYTDVGASGASLELILTLFGGGALGVGMQEVVNYVKARTGYAEADRLREQFEQATTDQLRDEVLSDAERAFELGRGDLKAQDIERSPHEIRVRAQSTSTGKRLLLVKNADGTTRLRSLPSAGRGEDLC